MPGCGGEASAVSRSTLEGCWVPMLLMVAVILVVAVVALDLVPNPSVSAIRVST